MRPEMQGIEVKEIGLKWVEGERLIVDGGENSLKKVKKSMKTDI
jgi:hypothetical protein